MRKKSYAKDSHLGTVFLEMSETGFLDWNMAGHLLPAEREASEPLIPKISYKTQFVLNECYDPLEFIGSSPLGQLESRYRSGQVKTNAAPLGFVDPEMPLRL